MQIRFNEAEIKKLAKAAVKEEAEALAARANAVASTTDPAATDPYYKVDERIDGQEGLEVQTTHPRAVMHERKTQALQKSIF